MNLTTVAVVVVSFALALLPAPLATDAQPAGKVHRIGFLGVGSASGSGTARANLAALRQGLRDLGYEEGRNLVIEYRWADEQLDRLPAFARELVGLKVDLIVTHGTPGSRAAKQATTTIPVVMASVGDPVRSGIVASLARPGGNVTGLSIQDFELHLKRLDLLKQAVPAASRVVSLGVAGQQPQPVAEANRREAVAAGRLLGVQLQFREVRGVDDFRDVFPAMVRDRADALLLANVATLNLHITEIAALATKHRLPAIAGPRAFVQAGGLLAYGVIGTDMYRRAATYVDKILKGAKPADLPVEQPTKFELVINLKAAKALGLTIPPSVLARADEVIQ